MSAPIFYISTEEYDALTPGATCALGWFRRQARPRQAP